MKFWKVFDWIFEGGSGEGSGWIWEGFWEGFGWIWECFWKDFQWILERFSIEFSKVFWLKFVANLRNPSESWRILGILANPSESMNSWGILANPRNPRFSRNLEEPNESKGILTNPSESKGTLRKRGSQAQVVWRAQLASASERAQRSTRKDFRSD